MLSFKLLFRFQGKSFNLVQARFLYETHYDVLNLKKDCTTKEVRSSFIELSKKYHPDKRINDDSHTKYLQIVEAYKVLGNTNRRADYDLNFTYSKHTQTAQNVYESDEECDPVKKAWSDPSFHASRHKNQYRETRNAKKFILTVILSSLVLVWVIYSYTLWGFLQYYRKNLDTESAKNSAFLEKAQSRANSNNFDRQIEHIFSKTKD